MKKIALLLLAAIYVFSAQAQTKDAIEKIWYNQEKTSKIKITKGTDGIFSGQIIWLKDSLENGAPKLDKKNVEADLRSRKVMRLVILKNFKASGNNLYEGGTVYDPAAGKTYCAKMTLDGNTIKLKGFICGFSMLGRTSTWTLAEK